MGEMISDDSPRSHNHYLNTRNIKTDNNKQQNVEEYELTKRQRDGSTPFPSHFSMNGTWNLFDT